METTPYYDEFLRYSEMAKWQHKNCNLGKIPHFESSFDDDLMKKVHLYDVVERKYAGFTQLLLDMFHDARSHPYKRKLTDRRSNIIKSFDGVRDRWGLEEWLFIFFVHRLTGSGINYAKVPSGYHNSPLLHFNECKNIKEMIKTFKSIQGPKYTSVGYQIAPFPKPPVGYSRGGDYFICEKLPQLIKQVAKLLEKGGKKEFRAIFEWLEKYNRTEGFKVYHFQYGAAIADIADFFPEFVDLDSHYFYGKNALECMSYLIVRKPGKNKVAVFDELVEDLVLKTKIKPYNLEDVMCDFIRWVENYVDTRHDYGHVCLDTTWSSHRIHDHPFGRQKYMLEMGLVDTFNGRSHPSDDFILKASGISVDEYSRRVHEILSRKPKPRKKPISKNIQLPWE